MSAGTHTGVFLVALRFAPDEVHDPEVCTISSAETLASGLPARADREQLIVAGPAAGRVLFTEAEHVWQCARRAPDDRAEARYLFDGVYANAHPESLDVEHLRVLHGTLAAKMYDDGVLLLDDAGLAASLRWPALGAAGVRLTRGGARLRRPG